MSRRPIRRVGVETTNFGYEGDPANLARWPLQELMEGFTEILDGCRSLLKPGGFLVLAARPFRRQGRLVDIPAMATGAALDAGYTLHEHYVALLAAACDDGLMTRASFFQLVNSRNAFAAGNPTHITAHEEIIVARLVDAAAEGQAAGAGCGCVLAAQGGIAA